MRADAPGKLVLSGAYAVLEGAPAVVTAVSRRVIADSSRPAEHLAEEVLQGLRILGLDVAPPSFDAGALRHEGQKLGLGSSAAICVASLGAVIAERDVATAQTPKQMRERVYPIARMAHRLAQGGGSGIDVAASCFGGTLLFQRDESESDVLPTLIPVQLPTDLTFEVWAFSQSASTSDFVARVFALRTSQPKEFARAMDAQKQASFEAADALKSGNASDLLRALRAQFVALDSLGRLAQLPIVLPQVHALAHYLDGEGCLLPSGAGGGDVNIHVSPVPSSHKFRSKAQELGFFPVHLAFGDEGLRVLQSTPSREETESP